VNLGAKREMGSNTQKRNNPRRTRIQAFPLLLLMREKEAGAGKKPPSSLYEDLELLGRNRIPPSM